MTEDGPHWAKIWLSYRKGRDDENVPYKWLGQCICGWRCMSWEWSRDWYYACNPDQLEIVLRECGPDENVTGGALRMTLEHLGLYNTSVT